MSLTDLFVLGRPSIPLTRVSRVTEGFQFQTDNSADSELVYSIRSLISEGKVTYCVVEKDEEQRLVTIEKKIEGPTAFITTTVMESLEAQMEDRLFTIHPDESEDQTKKIIEMIGDQRAGKFEGLDAKTISSFKLFHLSLKPVDVIIPFAPDIVRFINRLSSVPIATRRAAKRVMSVIQTIACAYQHQRPRDPKGRVLAEIADYWMSFQVVQGAFRENMGAQDKKTEKYLQAIQEKKRITPGNLAKMFGVSGAAISGWIGKRREVGMVEWCDQEGYYFIDDKTLETAKHKGTAYLKITETYDRETVTGLPTPYQLTGDPRWKEGGDLLKLYDLELEKRTALSTVFTGVYPVFTPALNTVKEDKMVNIIEYLGDEPDGVMVFGQIPGGEGNNLKMEDDGLKVVTPEPVDDFQKIQGGNGQGKSDSHPLDEFLKGFEGSLF